MNRRILPPTAVPFLLVFLLAFTAERAGAQLFWNQAASFAGTATSYIAIPSSSELNITGSFTIECWVNPTNITSPTAQILVGKSSAGDVQYDLRLSSSGHPSGTFTIRTNGSTRATSASAIPQSEWSHIAVSFEAGSNTFSFFINGSLDTSIVITGAVPTSTTDSVFIGTGYNNDYAGLMDEVRIWNRALSGTEIQRNYRTSLGATGGAYNGLVLSLTFQSQQGSGTGFSLVDWSGNGNSGVNRGVTAVNMKYALPTYLSFNEGVTLDGADDYLAGPDNIDVSPTAAITLEAWVLPNATGTGVLISKGTTAAYRILLLGTGNLLRAGVSGTYVSSTDSIPPGRWSHVAFTYGASSGAYAFYVNGRDAGSGTNAAGAITDNGDSLTIGGGQGLVDFNGYMDEVRIASYAKTGDEIRRFLYASIEQSNEPNSGETNVCYNLDGYAVDNCVDGGPRLYFQGGAMFSNPGTVSNIPVSPLDRLTGSAGFARGFTIKTSDRRIPETGTFGSMVRDSLYISQSTTISDINFFLATNHTYDSDLDVSLIAPNGDSLSVITDWSLRAADDNIITVFDNDADSAYTGSRFTSFAPVIQPEGDLDGTFGGDNSIGWWILSIYDDFGGDTGRVYAWGIQINNQTTVDVDEQAAYLPTEYALAQNYPNPFNPVTTIAYSIGARGPVTLEIYDLIGRRVATLVNEEKSPGHYRASFDARAVASGTYFYRLTSRDFVQVRKMLLLR